MSNLDERSAVSSAAWPYSDIPPTEGIRLRQADSQRVERGRPFEVGRPIIRWIEWPPIARLSPRPPPSPNSRRTSPSYSFWHRHRCLDTWRGIGDIAAGMFRQGGDLQLTEYGDGRWRATFYVTGQAHSVVGGSAWEPAAWTAVQKPACESLGRGDRADA